MRVHVLIAMEKRRVKYETYSKWLVQYDREYQTKTWLDCETQMDAGSKVVNELKCLIFLVLKIMKTPKQCSC